MVCVERECVANQLFVHSVCGKGVCRKSIICSQCSCWILKRCSDIRGRLIAVANSEAS